MQIASNFTEDYHPPGRHQNRTFRLLQPFRAKTSIFIKKVTFTSPAATGPPPWIPTFWGVVKPWTFMEISFGGTLGARSRSESVVERARSALERSKMTEGGPQAAQEPTLDHSGSILERFQVSKVLRASAGPSRGALLPKLIFSLR